MSKSDKKRITTTVNYQTWSRLKKIEADKELWGLDKTIAFLLDDYEKNKLNAYNPEDEE